MQDITARQALSDALRYWEPRRILYNGALALVVGIAFLVNLWLRRRWLLLAVGMAFGAAWLISSPWGSSDT